MEGGNIVKVIFTVIMSLFGALLGFGCGMFLGVPGEIAIVGTLVAGMGCIVYAIDSK